MNPGDINVAKYDGVTVNTKMRYRVRELWGYPVNKKSPVKRKDTAVPWPLWFQDGTGYDLRLEHTDSGHLMSLGLGGPNVSHNVVPMYSGFNRWGQWKDVEHDFVKLVKVHSPLYIQIKVEYNGLDKRIPSSFDVRAIAGAKQGEHSFIGGNEVYSKLGIAHSCPMPACYILQQSEYDLVIKALQAMTASNWTMEAWASAQNPHGNALQLPGNGIARPYAVLDYMAATNQIGIDTIGNGQKFSANQRQNILTVNRILYGGAFVKSDDPNDPYQVLSIDGGDHGAEIDHIVPRKGQSGSNAYSNARVVSWQQNKSKGMS